jgi:hypothetical protein
MGKVAVSKAFRITDGCNIYRLRHLVENFATVQRGVASDLRFFCYFFFGRDTILYYCTSPGATSIYTLVPDC